MQESAQITFKPLYGADSKHDPLCFLLVVDDVTILLDCGWDERFNLDTIAPLIAYVRRGDCFALVLGTPCWAAPVSLLYVVCMVDAKVLARSEGVRE